MPAQKYASMCDTGYMKPFPSCCSAKTLSGLGLSFTTDGDKVAPQIVAKIPRNITGYGDRTGLAAVKRLPATLRSWPVRIWYSELLYTLYKKRTTGEGGGDHYRTKTFLVSDNTVGARLYQRGSGFALWCRNVPGVKVVRSGTYPGAHGGVCESFIITITNVRKVARFLQISTNMLNQRLERLRTSPERNRRGSNDNVQQRNARNGLDVARYW